MSRQAVLSTIIDADVKEALTHFCKARGLKLRYLIEQALIEQLEDFIDLEVYRARRHEKTIPFAKVLSGRKRKN